MTPETQHLLYANETGELEGVFEVQLMDPVPVDRIPLVRALLGGPDLVAWSHALLVLLGWGDLTGLAEAERLLESDENPFLGIDTHRLYGADLTYDNIAHALAIGVSVHDLPRDRASKLARRLLNRSEQVFFQNGLENLITTLDDPALLDETEAAVIRLVEIDEKKGADLLPALASLDPTRASAAIERYQGTEGFTRATGLGVARALARMPSADSRHKLEMIASREDLPAASRVARETLDEWDAT